MSTEFSMESFQKEVLAAAEAENLPTARSFCANVFEQVTSFLESNSFAPNGLPGLEKAWSGQTSMLNTDGQIVGNLSRAKVLDLLAKCNVPQDQRVACATECLRELSGGISTAAVLEASTGVNGAIDITSMFGARGANTVNADLRLATEAFGTDSNNVPADNRLAIVLNILRTHTSVMDKVLPRVSENTNYIVMKTDMGEVYDITKSMDKSSDVRNGAATRRPLADLFRTPDMVNSQPQAVVPDANNDTDDVKKLVASVEASVKDPQALVSGVRANLWDLVYDEDRLGYQMADYSDLLAEGGRLKNVLVKVTKGTGSSAVSEVIAVPTQYLPTAKFTQTNNNDDVVETAVNVKQDWTLRAGRKLADNQTVSAIFSAYTKAVVQITVTMSVMLNLQTGDIIGTGALDKTLKPAAGQTDIDPAIAADFKGLSFEVLGYTPDLFFSEENLRKTNIAVRVKTKQNTFTIPNGRSYVFDLALQQETDSSTLSMVSTVSSLGNSIRTLTIALSTLNEIGDQLEFLQDNPEMSSMVDPRNMSIASSVVIPAVMRGTLNLNDGDTYVMRESERLSEGHARLRQTLLYALAQVCAKSLYLNQLGSGEVPVFKVVTHNLIKDLLVGITDYHARLDDKQTKTGADISLFLPNGFRLDVVGTNFTSMEGQMLIFPIRQADPTGVTSFGTIRDRGNYTAQYTPINKQGVQRRVIQNTREILMPTNPIGGLLTITGLKEFLSAIDAQFTPTTGG